MKNKLSGPEARRKRLACKGSDDEIAWHQGLLSAANPTAGIRRSILHGDCQDEQDSDFGKGPHPKGVAIENSLLFHTIQPVWLVPAAGILYAKKKGAKKVPKAVLTNKEDSPESVS
jgi:hypothetical protein